MTQLETLGDITINVSIEGSEKACSEEAPDVYGLSQMWDFLWPVSHCSACKIPLLSPQLGILKEAWEQDGPSWLPVSPVELTVADIQV